MSQPILHSFRFCPYALRARMALGAAGVLYDHREINLAQKPPAFLEISAKGTVPVLLLQDGTVIDESLDIMKWAMTQNDAFGWLGLPEDEQNMALELIQHNDTVFARNSYYLRNPHKVPYDDLSDKKKKKSHAELYEEPCIETCAKLNQIFEQQPFLSGQSFGLTDAAIFPFVWLLWQDVSWMKDTTYPHLITWLQTIEKQPVFLHAMKRHNFWQGKKAV